MKLSGAELKRRVSEMKYHGKEENLLVEVSSEKSVIDPRSCGNIVRYVNHSYRSNDRLKDFGISSSRTVVMLIALDPILLGKEIVINYGKFSGRTASPLTCHWSTECRGHI